MKDSLLLIAVIGVAMVTTPAPALGSAPPDESGYRASSSPTATAGANAAQGGFVLTLVGPHASDRLTIFVGDTGRLVFSSSAPFPVPVLPNGEPDPECSQDGPNQVSCGAGHVGVVVGSMRRGNDVFLAARNVPVLFGAVIGGRLRYWSGGAGADRLASAGRGDGLTGGAGPDLLAGRGGADLVIGGKGRDRLLGGPARDALFGGPGRDRLNGGAGRDLCHGGPGFDRARSCALIRSVP